MTVNRYCSSSLQTIRMAAHAIKAGEGDVFVAGGVETVSRFQYGAADTGPPNGKFGERTSAPRRASEAASRPGRRRRASPTSTSRWARPRRTSREIEGVTREEMDEFAVQSQDRAVAAQENGFFEREITPVTTPDGTVVSKDDGPRAGHDGREARDAEAGVPSRRRSHRRQRVPAQRRRGRGGRDERHEGERARHHAARADRRERRVSALDPEIMGLGPIEASRQALKRAGLTIDDIDLVEINEAFAAQAIPSAKHLGIPFEKLNVHGGAIALGHPFGMTGARIMTTLINGLQTDGTRYGLETMCVGGGQGMAMIVERLS